MQKRGSTLTLKPVIEILIAAIVIAAFLAVARGYGSQEIFQKSRVARDVALSVDALYASPENSWIKFPYDVSKYSFDFFEQKVKVWETRGEVEATSYPYVGKVGLKPQTIDKPQSLFLAMSGGEFTTGQKLPSFQKYSCEKIKKKLLDQKIQFAVGKEAVSNVVVEKIKRDLQQKSLVGCEGCTSVERLSQESLLIKLESGEKNKFKAYFKYNNEESRNLGCFILNQILDEYPEAKISLIPTDEEEKENYLILNLGEIELAKTSQALTAALEAAYE